MQELIVSILIALGIVSPFYGAQPPQVNTDGLFEQVIIDNPEPVSRARDFIPLDAEVQDRLFDLCDELGLDPALALALIQTESNFQTDAVSCAGCYGLCQLNPVYFPSGLAPAENIEYGLRYLARNIAAYGSTEAGLCAYNAGHDTGDRGYANLVISRSYEWSNKLK